MNSLTELEKYKHRFHDYHEILTYIFLKTPEERNFIMDNLLRYLALQPAIIIDRIHRVKIVTVPDHRYILSYHAVCGECKRPFESEVNLVCFWSPRKIDSLPICDDCEDKYREYEMDARIEAKNDEDYGSEEIHA